ncbi:polysaccharide lyase family 1 protein [Lophiostoma macrostomum CBS 122681]|uniref:Probable pectate lyase C n=1 Tax=Lophiostoma macrostomum CBS 122681 TaxID=1314788 RepID=A0A6A6T2C0_9PLEO|nr:polysaccharide lyase family 1 protein [Lophiostoma macrostomum CBS 122681]
MHTRALLSILLFLPLPFTTALTTLPAFPGAEGFGRNAIGGRHGTVYTVTNLNDSGAGSLRDAVSQPDRIVVFAVGGLIQITDRIVVSKRVSILGQTAPADSGGVTVYGNGWSFSGADDVVVRYIRIRMGKSGTSGKDAITIASGSNMIFDHLSVSWGRDETFSISGSSPSPSNITIQNSIIAQGLQTHSCGGLIQTALGSGISLLRNLYIDNKTRNPKVKGTNEFVNNVVYNWGGGGAYIAGDSEAVSEVNVVGNYFVKGPDSSVDAFTRGNANFRGFVSGNWVDGDKDGSLNGKELPVNNASYGGMAVQGSRFAYPGVAREMSAGEAVTYVGSYAGASLSRDQVDRRLVEELKSLGTMGELISDENASPMAGPGVIAQGTKAVDSDGDGIPDEVETKMGWDAGRNDAMEDKDGNGYVNVEDWANSLVPGTY